MFAPPPCPECGSDSVHHGIERILVAFDRLFTALFRPFRWLFGLTYRLLDGTLNRFSGIILTVLGRTGLGVWRNYFDEHDALRTRALFETAVPRGIDLRQFRLFKKPHLGFLVARKGGELRVFEALPRPNFLLSKNLSWMDDKGVLKKKFSRGGFPVAAGGTAMTSWGALRLFRKLRKPVITKPAMGSGSRHTTIHLHNEEEFLRAFRSARRLSPWVVIEEELRGPVFRATVVGGKLIGVVRRDPPQIIGDGKKTVGELVAEANRDPRRQGPIFGKIAAGVEAAAELERQGLDFESIPLPGQIVTLNQKITWENGGTTADVTDRVHLINVKLFENIAAFLEDPLIGIDFIIPDIGNPWQNQDRSGVVELNSMPFLDNHHYLFEGQPRDAAGAVWDITFDTGPVRG